MLCFFDTKQLAEQAEQNVEQASDGKKRGDKEQHIEQHVERGCRKAFDAPKRVKRRTEKVVFMEQINAQCVGGNFSNEKGKGAAFDRHLPAGNEEGNRCNKDKGRVVAI